MAPVLSIVMPYPTRADLDLALKVTTAIDVWQIPRYKLPALYSTGIRFQRDVCRAPGVPGACERFLTAAQCYQEYRQGSRLGFDCDDLAPWRAAELQLAGINAKAIAMRSSIGWHIVVELPDGRIEDPSKHLGMKGTH